MKPYHKIQTVFKRDPATNHRTLLEGQFSLPEFEYLKDAEWVFTEKVDGTNIRVEWNDGVGRFAGRTNKAQIPLFLLGRLQQMFPATRLAGIADQFTLYGEGYGNRIQKVGKRYIPDGVDFILFDVRVGDWWLNRDDVADIAERLDCKVVPEVGRGTLLDAVEMTRGGLESLISRGLTSEGLIMRPAVELRTRSGDRIISKVKWKDFRFAGPLPPPTEPEEGDDG